MACKIPYIQNQPFSETEKERLEKEHISIFSRAKQSGAFREYDKQLYAKKNDINPSREFIAQINTEYGKPITKIVSVGNGNSILSVNVLPLSNEKQVDLFFNLPSPQVNFSLKSVQILQSPKADEIFRKGDKNNWTLDKILQELQVPKEQQELLKQFNTRNREELLTSLLANYSYTVEINTAKSNLKEGLDRAAVSREDYENFKLDNSTYKFEFIEFEVGEDEEPSGTNEFTKDGKNISEKEYEDAFEQYKRNKFNIHNSEYYSNLTVSGGTNYTENEIATPAITPSIKGHAQFATDKGIGWFRSDDAQTKDDLQRELYTQDFTFEELLQRGEIKQVPCR